MNTFFWIIGLLAAVIIAFFVYVIGSMMFISQITQFKVWLSAEYEHLVEGLSIEELPGEPASTEREVPNTGDVEGSQDMLLHDDGTVKDGRHVFDGDPGQSAVGVFNPMRRQSHLFVGNEVFEYADAKQGARLGAFSAPGFDMVDFVLPVNAHLMIMDGAMDDSPYPSESRLWQARYEGLEKQLISDDPYYVHARTPKVFVFDDPEEQMLVYYEGSFDFGFGGDASRPKFSVLRLYNEQHPEGIDLIEIGFKAGTVIEVERVDGAYIVSTDPSLPRMVDKPGVPPRKWKIEFH